MSQYYNIKGLKVRVSDHLPNTSLRGGSDIYLFIKDASNQLMSIESQIKVVCDKKSLNISDFAPVIEDWKDGTYTVDAFRKEEREEGEVDEGAVTNIIIDRNEKWSIVLKSYDKPANREEIKELSALTGISQSFIKKEFNIR